MMTRTGTAITVLLLTQALGGCGGRSISPSAPTADVSSSTGAGAGARTTVTLADTGYVLDTAFKPLDGVRVEVLDGPQAGATMTSTAAGDFSLAGEFGRSDMFRATKDGYVAVTQGFQTSVPGGKPWLIFYLSPIARPANIAGDYTLTIVADSACIDLPPEARTRMYSATIASGASATEFVLTTSDASLLNNYRGFSIGVAGNAIGLWLHGGHDPSLVEQLGTNSYLAYSGMAATTIESSSGPTLSAELDGWIEYCVTGAPMGSTYNCGTSNITGAPIPGAAVAYTHCQSSHHGMLLTRR
ncbi:MAG: hypothetical protein ACRD2I_19175 [Vicinamibacterales bacterium]